MFNASQILMLVLAAGILAAGLARRRRLLGRKPMAPQHADWSQWFAVVFGQKRLIARPMVAMAHLCLVGGLIIFILIVTLAQTNLTLPETAAKAVSLALDVTGLLMLAAILYLFFRRIARNCSKKDQWPPKWTLLPLAILFSIVLSGFLVEGARLSLVPDHSAWAAPVGSLFSRALPQSPLFMQTMLRVHFVCVILLLLAVPFTFLRHLASTSLQLLYRDRGPAGLPAPCDLEQGPLGAATVLDLTTPQLREAEACTSCGRCDEQCPALASGKPLSPRTIMGKIAGQMEACSTAGARALPGNPPRLGDAISEEEIWACTTCLACVTHCPAYIRPLDKILELRRHLVMQQGRLPSEAAGMIRNLELFADVNGKGQAHRADWAFNRKIPRVGSSSAPPEVLLWVGCSGAFHPAAQQTSRDLVKLLRAGGVDFAILAQEEFCCGDPARKLGEEALFTRLARQNIQRFEAYGISKIVTLCPHCLNTLGRDYGALGCQVEVVPAVSLVEELLKAGKISLRYPLEKSLTVHDPCYLGRYHGIYEPIRRVCGWLPGAELRELKRTRENSFCCGGGGSRMWLHETTGEKINVMRAREVVAAGVDTVVTACPYCLTMLEDGVKTVKQDAPTQVVDIISLAAEALADEGVWRNSQPASPPKRRS